MNSTSFIDEVDVELEFAGSGRHVDIRFGILNHGVLDGDERQKAWEIKIGIIGTVGLIDGFLVWLNKCGDGVDAKESNRPNLFPRFPGFGEDSPFNACWTCDARSRRGLSSADIAGLGRLGTPGEIVKGAVRLYLAEIEYLVNETRPDVIFCIVPDELSEQLDRAAELARPLAQRADDEDDDTSGKTYRHDFHHCLKAEAMRYQTPIQLTLPSTFEMGTRGKATKRKRPRRRKKDRQLQDPATRAWNLFTAMYYKAGGAPWRLVRDASDYTTCYIGVSFYKSLDEQTVMTSIAQVFNERGEGIVVRGGQARLSKKDRTPHLTAEDSAKILVQALQRYRAEHGNMPARVVLHKSSYFVPDELDGFRSALQQERVGMADMLSLRPSHIRLFRMGQYPVLRGTHLPLGPTTHLLYTRGSVPFFETYPGMYVPRALQIEMEACEQSPDMLCREVLALTKMNWNSTEFDMRDPVTIHAARRVGDIMKYVPLNAPPDQIARRYSFYM
ncbi:MAG: hypothetical protein GXP25_14245 [Planctomycetes bacterium]|nr:hypothetical protein [Planctomycetota bacterium]